MIYYDLEANWHKVEPHVDHPEVQAVLIRDFNKYTWGRWRKKFEPGMTPTDFESADWQYRHRGPIPAFWSYTKHGACHWLVNFNLKLAQLVEPKRPWRILTSDAHSTVWDGGELLFDFNFLAMGIPPDKCFADAREEELKPGELLKVYVVERSNFMGVGYRRCATCRKFFAVKYRSKARTCSRSCARIARSIKGAGSNAT